MIEVGIFKSFFVDSESRIVLKESMLDSNLSFDSFFIDSESRNFLETSIPDSKISFKSFFFRFLKDLNTLRIEDLSRPSLLQEEQMQTQINFRRFPYFYFSC